MVNANKNSYRGNHKKILVVWFCLLAQLTDPANYTVLAKCGNHEHLSFDMEPRDKWRGPRGTSHRLLNRPRGGVFVLF